MNIYVAPVSRRLYVRRDTENCARYWAYPTVRQNDRGWTEDDHSRSVFVDGRSDCYGPPPSTTLRTLIECGAPWYAVLDKFVEEYPQWEEILAWAPIPNSEGE